MHMLPSLYQLCIMLSRDTSKCKQRSEKWPLGEKLSVIVTCDAKVTDVLWANFPFGLI